MPTYRYRPLHQLSNVIKLLYGVCLVIVSFLVYGIIRQISLIGQFVNASEIEEPFLLREMQDLEATQIPALGTLAFVSVIASIIFLRWTYVAAMNAQASTEVELSNSPGWCVGWYFVPIANLWKPYTALKEIWEISDVHRGSGAIVGIWWFLRIATSIFERVHSGLSAEAFLGGPEDLLFVNYLALGVNGMTIGLYVLNGVIVHRLSRMQEEKHRLGADHDGVRECSNCGEPLDAGAVECPMCGAARPGRPSSEFRPTFENVDADLDEFERLGEDEEPPAFERRPGGRL